MKAAGARYALVALVCMVVHNAIMILGDRAGLTMPFAVSISFCLVVMVGFVLHSRFTFAVKSDARSLLRYTLGMAANLPLTVLLLWMLLEPLRWPMTVAAPAGTAIMVGVNFVVSRWAIASRRGAPA